MAGKTAGEITEPGIKPGTKLKWKWVDPATTLVRGLYFPFNV
jgi:hypothetical protein